MKTKLIDYLLAATLLNLTLLFTVSAQTIVNVRFAEGKDAATYTGTIKGRRYVDYAVKVSEGQTMTVKLERRRGEFPYFNVITKSSEVAIADDAREVSDWSGTLSAADTYVVRVYVAKAARLAGRSSNYRLTISLNENGATAKANTVLYECDGGVSLTADFTPGPPPQVRVRFGTQDINLPLEPSASGSKYEFNDQMFWVKGDEALLETKVLNANCKTKQ